MKLAVQAQARCRQRMPAGWQQMAAHDGFGGKEVENRKVLLTDFLRAFSLWKLLL